MGSLKHDLLRHFKNKALQAISKQGWIATYTRRYAGIECQNSWLLI
jgi:hypothetical protein